MKQKSLFVGILFFFLTALLMGVTSFVPYAMAASASDRYIVVLEDNVSSSTDMADEMETKHGLKMGHVYQHALKGFSATIPENALAELKRDPRVKYIEPDGIAYALEVQTLPTGINRIDADVLGCTAKIDEIDERVNVGIAIIDTGIDLDHPDLNVVGNVSFVSGIMSGDDDNGHGSHVAGTAAAIDNGSGVVGVAPGANLYAVKVLDSNGSGYWSDVIAGIEWVTANAVNMNIAVANMSLGGTGKLQSLRDAITASVNSGVVYVVAAGNSSQDVYGTDKKFGTADDFIPAAYPEVAAVSALADSDGKAGGIGGRTNYGSDDTIASFSNFSRSVVNGNPVNSPGKAIDFAAPGVNILSTYKDGGYAIGSGASMASPHAAGCVALYIAGARNNVRAANALEVAAIRQALINCAVPQTKWGPRNTGDPDGNKEGLVDASKL